MAIRASLEFTSSARDLDPSVELTGQILHNARSARNCRQRHRGIPIVSILRAFAFVAGIVALATASFGLALSRGGLLVPPTAAAGGEMTQSDATLAETQQKDLERVASEVRMLSGAVRPATMATSSPEELKQWRAVRSMDADIAAARAALERNPGCERASSIVNANLQRQAETLRNLYVGRAL